MKYENVIKGEFISRPNRFIAKVNINAKEETVHVKNTGRCKELLIKGATVYLSVSDKESRKTKYDLIAVEKIRENGKALLINMDSQIPNDVAEEYLKKGEIFSKDAVIKREVTYKNSRFDIFVADKATKAFVEVKGVTLENNGVAMFPDAPTLRGVKHIKELIAAKNEGYDAYILFVIQMKGVRKFTPNAETHPEFAEILKVAEKSGVKILAYDCRVDYNTIEIGEKVSVIL